MGLLLTCNGFSDIIFQADFKGSGFGTGGTQDLVTLGGRGLLKSVHNDASRITSEGSILTKPAMGTGSFLNWFLMVMGATGPGEAKSIVFTPDDAAHSWAAMAKIVGTQVFIDGGFDFFTRANKRDDSAIAWFRPLDVGDGKTQLRIDVSSVADSSREECLQLEVIGLGGVKGRVATKFPILVGSIYHLGASFSTDLHGNITAKLFGREGGGVLSEDSLLGTVTFQVDAAPYTKTSELLPSGEFMFGGGRYDSGNCEVNMDYALFRMYNSAPQTFAALPQ